jgi:hypothetical protein
MTSVPIIGATAEIRTRKLPSLSQKHSAAVNLYPKMIYGDPKWKRRIETQLRNKSHRTHDRAPLSYKNYLKLYPPAKSDSCADLRMGTGVVCCCGAEDTNPNTTRHKTATWKTVAIVMTSVYLPKTKLNSVTLVRERTISTKRPLLVGEVSANFIR